jgi:hypothetical protein
VSRPVVDVCHRHVLLVLYLRTEHSSIPAPVDKVFAVEIFHRVVLRANHADGSLDNGGCVEWRVFGVGRVVDTIVCTHSCLTVLIPIGLADF